MSDFWTACLEQIKNDTPRDVFQTWFADLTADVELEAGSITILAPSGAKLRTVRDSYGTTITQYVNRQAGKEMDIVWAVAQSKPQRPFAEHVEENKPDIAATGLLPNLTFENLVEGQANQMAFASALQVASSTHSVYNPLFIYGGVGLGKTHLMHAIGNQIKESFPSFKIVYVTSETFTYELIQSIQENTNAQFRNKYRNVDVLMVDDIQFISGKVSTQEEFFNTFNALQTSGKQIVISSDKPPMEMLTLEERLRSRFEGGLITDIQPPDLETRIAILRKKATLENINIDEDVLAFIAEKVNSNIRQLEGALTRVIAYSKLTRKDVDIVLADTALKDIVRGFDAPKVSIQLIQQIVADYYDIDVEGLLSQRRTADITYPRQIAMFLCREMTGDSLKTIGKHFGGRDYSTVISAYNKIMGDLKKDPELGLTLDDLRKRIKK